MSGEALLDRCFAAHGGLDRWRQFGAIDVDLTTSGLVFATHGQSSLRTMARVATREPLVVLSPYRRWPRGVFQRDRVFIEDASGRVMAERKNPRARMGRGRRLLWWDTLDTLYFVGYALSNYVRAPFMFAQNGFHVMSAGVATFGSGTWSTLRVTFPVDEPTHCPTQVYYLDAAHLIRRLDYVAEPIGRWARAAHFCADYRESRGLRAPTRRWVVPRTRDDRVVSWPPLVQIRITAVRPISNALIADGSSHAHPSEAPRSL
jgi:hypothetical protein